MPETPRRYGHLLIAPVVVLAGMLLPPAVAQAQEAVHLTESAPTWSEESADLPRLLPASYAQPGGCAAPAGGCGPGGPCCDACGPKRWYISISGGWQHRETVHEANDPLTFIVFDDGFAANAALGYRFDMFRIEAEYSFMNNEVDTAGAAGLSSPAAGNVGLRALMFNVYHDVDIDVFSWKPYVGAGIGLYQSEINSLYPDFFDVAGPPLAGTAVNTTSDMPFAYQFRVGATRQLGKRTEFYLGYRYFRGEELEFASLPFSNFAPTFHPQGTKNHAIEFGLRIRF